MGPRDEGFQVVDLGSVHRGQFPDFHDPRSGHDADHILRIADVAGQFVRPVHPEDVDEGRFPGPLRTFEDRHEVELVTRLIGPSHRAHQGQHRTLAMVCAVLAAEVVNEEGLDALLPIPLVGQ